MAYIASFVTSPKTDDHKSMCVIPGNWSRVHCGKSSIVISPYFFRISATCGLVPRGLGLLLNNILTGQQFVARRPSFSFSSNGRGAALIACAAAAMPAADRKNPRRGVVSSMMVTSLPNSA